MPRLTRRAFRDLAIWMVGLGLLAGVAFPFFVLILGVPKELALTPRFFSATLVVGIVVGSVNFGLALLVFGPRLRLLSSRMRFVEDTVREATFFGNWDQFNPKSCAIPVDSEDEIGDSAGAFNKLVETLGRSHEVVEAVSSFSRALSSHLEFKILSNQALELLLMHTGANAGAILAENNGELGVVSKLGLRNVDEIATSGYVRQALRTKEIQRLRMPPDLVIDGVVIDFRAREVIVAPVEFSGTPFGVVILASVDLFPGDVMRLPGLLIQGLGLALNNAMSHERLQHISAVDPLTGLYNRRFGMTRLSEEYARALRMHGKLGVLMLDIDHFKNINDTHGHLVGDRYLILVAQVARRVLREGDILVRYGGEEFYAILPGASIGEAKEIAERLRHVIEGSTLMDGDQEVKTTVSIGITSYPEMAAISEDSLIERADEALYAAKAGGRNRVVTLY
ncbi:MAG: GGDEF domain-containing protein [Alphaproteobacteria bacterium]|nr:GGDEF domain-containing protein [Alphaproteobacteria bacterium]